MTMEIIHTTLLMFLAIGVGTYIAFSKLLGISQDPREPPPVSGSIPYIGHVAGLLRNKFNYYIQLSHQCSLPIFTVAMPGQKIYVVTTSDLIQAIQKLPAAFAFPPIEARFVSRVCGSSEEAHKIVMKNLNGDEGDWGLSIEVYAAIRAALSAGPGLDGMNHIMAQHIAMFLDNLVPSFGSPVRIELAKWLRQTVTAATTHSVYGPRNPFQDLAVADAFWQFENNFMPLLVGILPSVTAYKGIAGRAKVVQAFENYFRTDGHKQASLLIQDRYNVNAKNGVSVSDIARFEVAGAFASIVNTAPAVFWMLLLIYSHPGLVDELRKELDQIVTEQTRNGDLVRSFDITSLKTRCPLLFSTYQEVLRYRSIGISVRQVMEDTILDGRWLLKRDCMIQMPSQIIHMNSSWGSDAEKFNPRRFLKNEPQKTPNRRRPSQMAFRAFGGGTTLCPGRHFATHGILALVSMFVIRYDMIPTTGKWALPTTDNTNFISVIMEPDTDVEVEISPRNGFEIGQWAFDLKDSGLVSTVVAEDRPE